MIYRMYEKMSLINSQHDIRVKRGLIDLDKWKKKFQILCEDRHIGTFPEGKEMPCLEGVNGF